MTNGFLCFIQYTSGLSYIFTPDFQLNMPLTCFVINYIQVIVVLSKCIRSLLFHPWTFFTVSGCHYLLIHSYSVMNRCDENVYKLDLLFCLPLIFRINENFSAIKLHCRCTAHTVCHHDATNIYSEGKHRTHQQTPQWNQ